jgi:type I restriction enzyme S subunit
MVTNYKTVKLSEVTIKIGSGATPRGGKESYKNEGIPLIRSQNVYDLYFDRNGLAFIDNTQAKELDNVAVEKNDVLLNITGASVCRCTSVPDDLLPSRVNQHVSIVRANNIDLLGIYLKYLLVSPKYKQHLLAISSAGATREALTKSNIENLSVEIPEISIQHKVASLLSNYDKIIDNNNKRIKILEEMAQTIYTEWFVNFRFPGHEKVKMVDSELGRIPEGWTIKKMEDLVVRFTAGKKYDNKTVKLTGKVPVLDQGQTGIIGFHDEEPGFISSWDNPVIVFANHTCYQKIISYPFSAIQNVIPFKPINETMDIIWLHYSSKDLIKLNDYKGHWPEYMSKRLVIPDNLDITRTFGTILIPMLKEIELFEKRNKNLSKTRDLLIPKLISGEIDVSEIDI